MTRFFKLLYARFAQRIYSVGKLHYEDKQVLNNGKHALIGEGTFFYVGASIQNMTNDIKRIVIGKNCHIYGAICLLPFGGRVQFGDNCSFGDLSRIVSCKEIVIGNRVMIAHNVNILDNNSHPIDASLRHEDFMKTYSGVSKEFDLDAQEINIEDDVWIGFNSIILKGVTIGRGAIIGAGSVVTKDVAPWTVNVGNPLRCVKKLEPINFL